MIYDHWMFILLKTNKQMYMGFHAEDYTPF